MTLAIRTGIAPSVWVDEGSRAVFTALEVLRGEEPDDPDGPMMSG